MIVERKCRQLIEGQHSRIDIARTLLTNYDRHGNRTNPSGQIEEEYDGTLLFSKYHCIRFYRRSLIAPERCSYNSYHSTI